MLFRQPAAGAEIFANIWDASVNFWNYNTTIMELESLTPGGISIDLMLPLRGTSPEQALRNVGGRTDSGVPSSEVRGVRGSR